MGKNKKTKFVAFDITICHGTGPAELNTGATGSNRVITNVPSNKQWGPLSHRNKEIRSDINPLVPENIIDTSNKPKTKLGHESEELISEVQTASGPLDKNISKSCVRNVNMTKSTPAIPWHTKTQDDNQSTGAVRKEHSTPSDRSYRTKNKDDANITYQNNFSKDKDKYDVFTNFEIWSKSKCPSLNSKCKIEEINGDLFTASKEYALAHCVAADFSMGSGIATTFKSQFKNVEILLDQRQKQGGLAMLKIDDRFIYYMVTKPISSGKPTYFSLCKSLVALKDHMVEHHVTKLAIPRIGCGLDRLNWNDVKKMIGFVFQKYEVEILVYNFDKCDESEDTTKYSKQLRIIHTARDLNTIERGTALFFIASKDHAVSTEILCLKEKFDFISDYNQDSKELGEIYRCERNSEVLYGLYCKPTLNDAISYKHFANAIKKFNKINVIDKFNYVGIQAFDDGDDCIVKLCTLFKCYLKNVEVHICYPKLLENLMPVQILRQPVSPF